MPINEVTTQTLNQIFSGLSTKPIAPDKMTRTEVWVEEVTKQPIYFEEFFKKCKEETPKLKATDDDIKRLWNLIVEAMAQRDVSKTVEFLNLAESLGLTPLGNPDARHFWNHWAIGKPKALGEAKKLGQSSLEGGDIGGLLDNLSVFNKSGAGWDISQFVWTLVSRAFALGSRGDIHVYMTDGMTFGSVFWEDELPILRYLQNVTPRLVNNIYVHLYVTETKEWIGPREIDQLIRSGYLKFVYDKTKGWDASIGNYKRMDHLLKLSFLTGPAKGFKARQLHRLAMQDLAEATDYAAREVTGATANPTLELELFPKAAVNQTKKFIVEENAEGVGVVTRPSRPAAIGALPDLEKLLIANWRGFGQLPSLLHFVGATFFAGDRVFAFRSRAHPSAPARWVPVEQAKQEIRRRGADAQKILTSLRSQPGYSDALLPGLALGKSGQDRLFVFFDALCDGIGTRLSKADRALWARKILHAAATSGGVQPALPLVV